MQPLLTCSSEQDVSHLSCSSIFGVGHHTQAQEKLFNQWRDLEAAKEGSIKNRFYRCACSCFVTPYQIAPHARTACKPVHTHTCAC